MRNAVSKGAVLGVVAVVLTAGCTSSKKSVTPPPPAKTTALSAPKSTAPTLHQGTLPATVPNQAALRKNVVQTKCAAIPGGWGAEGTVKNTAAKALTYKIVVYFTTTKATTLDYAEATVKVGPGQTEPWKADKKFPAQPQMLCPMPGISAS